MLYKGLVTTKNPINTKETGMNKYNTIFGQLLDLVERPHFETLKNRLNIDKYSKTFSAWEQFVSMLYSQIAGKDSLRGVESGINSNFTSLYHLGVKKISKSTLAHANKTKDWHFYQDLFYKLETKYRGLFPKHKLKIKNPVYSLDSTTVGLCLSLFDWAKFRTTKGGIKIHVKLNHSGNIPNCVLVTEAKHHDQKIAHQIPFKKGDVVLVDRAYNDYKWLQKLENEGVFFVTRQKSNASYKIKQRKECTAKNISSDHIIKTDGYYASKNYTGNLRKIRIKDEEKGDYITLLTNNLNWSAKTISELYRARWQVELFFKSIKQNLKIKTFLGTSENAVMTQVWIAIITHLLMAVIKIKSKLTWSFKIMKQTLGDNLFKRESLLNWLNGSPELKGPPEIPLLEKHWAELF